MADASCWPVVELREAIDPRRPITYGIVQPGPRQPEGQGIPMIRGQDYSSGAVRTTDLYHVLPAISHAYSRSVVSGGDLLMSIVGYVGTVAVVPPELSGANLTQTTARLSVRSGWSARFLFQQLRSPQFRAEVNRYTKGSAQPGLNLADVERMRVAMPPLVEQRRIAEILDTVEDLISSTDRALAKSRKLRTALVSAALADLTSCEKPLTDFAPAGRPQVKTGPFGSMLKGEHWVERGVPVVTIGSLGQSTFLEDEFLHVGTSTTNRLAAYRLEPGDLIFSRVADVGRALVVPVRGEGWLMSSNLIRLTCDASRLDPTYLWLAITCSPSVRSALRRKINTGGRDVASSALLRSLVLPVPPIEQQRSVVARTAAVELIATVERARLAKLKALQRGLSNDLLAGRALAGV